jgi:hypothetical protein
VIWDEYELVRISLLLSYETLEFPGVQALIRERQVTIADAAGKQAVKDYLVEYGKVRYKAGIDYWVDHFSAPPEPAQSPLPAYEGTPLLMSLTMFKYARLCNPDYMREVGTTGGAAFNVLLVVAFTAFRTFIILAMLRVSSRHTRQGSGRSSLPISWLACRLTIAIWVLMVTHPSRRSLSALLSSGRTLLLVIVRGGN